MKKRIRVAVLLGMMIVAATVFTGCGYTGMRCDGGVWRYVKEDVVQYNYTGMASNDYGWWYFRNGLIDFSYTGMANNENGWWYYRNGRLDWGYTGLASNVYGQWLYRNGNLDFNYNGNWGDYLIKGGHVDHKHSYTRVGQVAATCKSNGYSGDYKCSKCSFVKERGYMTSKTDSHTVVSKVTKKATCASTGNIHYYCKVCNVPISDEEIARTNNHMHTSLVGAYEASCTSEGYTGDKVCDDCNALVAKGKSIAKVDHEWRLTQVDEANCVRPTTKHYSCKNCFETKEESLDDKKAHQFEDIYVERYSCVQDGYRLQQCKDCGEYNEIRKKAQGHDYQLASDKQSIVCKECGSAFTETISDKVKNDKLYVRPATNIAIGQELTVDGKQIDYNDYGFYEINRMYADFWSGMRIESSNTDSVRVLKHDYQTSYLIDACNNVTLDQQDVLRTGDFGKSHIKIYFHDILFDEFDMYVGATIVDGVKAVREGNDDSDLFNGYSSIQKDAVVAIADMLDKTVRDDMTDYQKVMAIKKWYHNNVTYNLTSANSDSNCEIFLNHQGKCEDYAETFALLMDVLGIENYYVCGKSSNAIVTYDANGAEVMNDGHAWNIVRIDAGNGKGAKWYYADMTWDQLDTNNTVEELNAKDGFGYYYKNAGEYRRAESFLKLRASDYSNDTQPWSHDSSQDNIKDFQMFQF